MRAGQSPALNYDSDMLFTRRHGFKELGRIAGMKKNLIWISFDLGVNGDYEGMYAWLDKHKAKECGDSLACLQYTHSGALLEEIRKNLDDAVKLNGRSRIYVIHLAEGRMKGSFIAGNRKSSPWTGYGVTGDLEEDVGE